MRNYNHIFSNKTCLITGGGSGIGKSLAIALSKAGADVYICGRDIKKLEDVREFEKEIKVSALDVTDSGQWSSLKNKIVSEKGRIDYVILNAGICEYVDLPAYDSDMFQRVIDTNFMGTVKGIEAFLPQMLERKSGHIIGITSSVASLPLPRAEAYGASKAAASYMLNSLRLALHHKGIKVSVVLPGFVESPMTDRNDFPMPFRISAESAADKILKGISKNKKEIYFPGKFTWPLRFLGILPMGLQQLFTKRFVR